MKHAIKFAPALLLSLAAGCSTPQDDGSNKALLNCTSAIKGASDNPAATNVPHAKDWGTGGEHYFAWPIGSGLVVAKRDRTRDSDSASCITDAVGVVSSVTINGVDIPIR